MQPTTQQDWINYLQLQPHPEGGWFSEIYRNREVISGSLLTAKHPGNRNLATSIYFMLAKGNVSKLHRLKSDELWYFHYGSPLIVHVFFKGEYKAYTMGIDIASDQRLQLVIPAGAIFGAEVEENQGFTIFGCMVSPGFHFDDFELLSFQQVMELYPDYKEIIERLT